MMTTPSGRRVVITGMGAVTALGKGVDPTWRAVLEGQSGVGYIRQFDSTAFPIRIGSEVNLATLGRLDNGNGHLQVPVMGRSAHFGMHATQEAWKDAGLEDFTFDRSKGGVCVGASTFPVIEDRLNHLAVLLDSDGWHVPNYLRLCQERPELLFQSDAARVSGLISRQLRLTGASTTFQAACTSATQAIGHAYDSIRRGQMEIVVAGGTDSMLSMMCVTGFTLLGSLAKRWERPSDASRPFDRTRDGFVLAEGSAMMVLEELEFARRRGARIYAEIIGYGSSCDAYRFTDVHPEGYGIALSMESALRQAEVAPSELDYINAHGTSTPLNDRCETTAIRKVFGEHATRLAVSSTKSQLGHLLCAAGAIELVFTALALHEGILPPTINLNHPDPECDLDYIPWKARPSDAHLAMSNSCGFGGQNGSIVLRRWEKTSPQALAKRDQQKSCHSSKPRRVVVTGIGLLSPLGRTARIHFARFLNGECAATPAQNQELADLSIAWEARVPAIDRRRYISHRMLRKVLTKAGSFAVIAAGQALRDARIETNSDMSRRCGLYVGSLGLDQDFNIFYNGLRSSVRGGAFDPALFTSRGMAMIDPLFLVKSLPNAGLCGISIQFGIHGRNANIMNGSISGLQAIGAAASEIREGAVDVAIAGGYDSLLQLEPAIGQIIAGNIGLPFKLNGTGKAEQSNRGYVLGEGAGFLVLESEDCALRRAARIYGEIASEAQSLNAGDTAQSAVDGLETTVRSAFGRNTNEEESLDVVFGDGLGLPSHDEMEAAVLGRLSATRALPFSAGTPAHGFCGVANSVFSSIHGLLSIYKNKRPPAWNWNSSGDSGVMNARIRDPRKTERALIWSNDGGTKSAAVVIESYRTSREQVAT